MKARDEHLARVASATNALLNGEVDTADVERLEELLAGDHEAQQLYLSYCQLHLELRSETRARRIIDEFAAQTDVETEGLLPIAPALTLRRPPSERARVPRRFHLRYLAAMVAVAVVVALVTWMRPQRPVAQQGGIENSTLDGQDIVMVKLSSKESRWLPIGEVGTIYVQGPADVDLIGDKRARLERGRVRVHITDPRGHGYVVETPQGEVTDLGTEFGVDVTDRAETGVVVFQGQVDLSFPSKGEGLAGPFGRLVQGEGLTFSPTGETRRIMSIVRGDLVTYRTPGEYFVDRDLTIVDVSDNIRGADVKSFYEIVPRGLKEDALAYVDRPEHEWNGVHTDGMPSYLVGADYVKAFNSDKMRSDVEITVTLAHPARLFVFFDKRVPPPAWLQESFRDTGDQIGHDAGNYTINGKRYTGYRREVGPGKSINSRFGVWERIVEVPGPIRLGPNQGHQELTAMYGIAAVPLDADPPADKEGA